MDLSVIIINWKSVNFTRKCLASIYANAGDLTYEVIVVDNASFDGCEQMVKSEFPQVTFIQSRENLGFARANNLAFAQSHGHNVMFLNPDTEIQGKALQKLTRCLESIPPAGMVGARLLNSDLSLQTTCIVALPSILNQTLNSRHLQRAFPKWRIWGMRPLFENSQEPFPVEAISGACMVAKRQVIAQVGGFTTDYFMYSEDMDLCLKVARSAWKIYFVPDASIVHHAAGSSSSRAERNFSSIMLRESVTRFMQLHHGRLYAMAYRLTTAFAAACRLLLLALALPVAIHPRGYGFIARAFSKWTAVLTWSLGWTPWVSKRTMRPPAESRATTEDSRVEMAGVSTDTE
jgi:N-acetylglucosaminyl-diphospho-decaprenol L-rhamnosyltransferase